VRSASKIKSSIYAWLVAMVVTLCFGETCVGAFLETPGTVSGQIALSSPESVGENYDASAYDASGYAVAPSRGAQLRAQYGDRSAGLNARINERAGYTPRTARAAEQLGDTGANATVLTRNLAREGRPVLPGEAAGHLVPSTGVQNQWAPGARARSLLQRFGVRINGGANGVPVGHPRPHNLTHRGTTFLNPLEARLNGVVDRMSATYGHRAIRAALQRELRLIGQGVRRN